MSGAGPRRSRRPGGLVVGLAALVSLGAAALLLAPPLSPELILIEMPREDQLVRHEALDVVVRFRDGEGVAPETFRVLLNGEDVTDAFTTAANGAFGRLRVLRDGENRLRFEVFGRSFWAPDRLVEDVREVRFRVRRPVPPDRARARPLARPCA